MKILHLISSGGMYGAEGIILNISRVLNGRGHRCLLGVFSNSTNPNFQLHHVALREGIDSHLITCRGQVDFGAIAKIRELVLRNRVDVVHAHGYKADVYTYFALRKFEIPFVSTSHNWLDNDLRARCYGHIDRFVLRRYARVVAVSEDVLQRLVGSGVDPQRTSIITNGIDLRPYAGVQANLKSELDWEDSPLVGLVGRLSPEKGVDIFFRAASLVLSEIPNAKFVVVGDGQDRARLEALIKELSITESVRILGYRTDMPSVYASLDIFVCASRTEGVPLAILEAMASRLPVVATTVGQLTKIILHEHTGLLVPRDAPRLMADAIQELLQNPTQRERLGSSARQRAQEEFSADRMASDYLKMYHEAIACSSSGIVLLLLGG